MNLRKLYWLLEPESKLSLNLKATIWTYGLEIRDSASVHNIETLKGFQLKTLRIITNA